MERRMTGHLTVAVRHNMRIELVCAMLFGLFQTAMGFIPVILRRLGGSPEVLAFYGAESYFAMMVAAPALVLLHKHRALRLLVVSWVVSRGLMVLLGFAGDVTLFLLVTGVFWMFEALPGPIYARVVQTIYPVWQRGKIMSLVKVGMAASMLIATPLAGRLLDVSGYQVFFPLAALAGVGSVLLFTRIKVDERQVSIQQTSTMGFLWHIPLQDHRYAVYLAGMVMFGLGGLVGNTFYPFVQVDQMHLSYGDIGWLGLVQAAFWLVSYFFWGRQIDRRGGMRVIQLCALLNAVQPFVYIFAQNGWMLLPAYVALGIVSAGTDIGFVNTYIQLAEPTKVPEYAAVHALVMGTRGIVGLFLGVVLHNLGMSFTMIFALGVMFNFVAFGLWTWVYGQTRKADNVMRKA
jgi:MFS family permease